MIVLRAVGKTDVLMALDLDDQAQLEIWDLSSAMTKAEWNFSSAGVKIPPELIKVYPSEVIKKLKIEESFRLVAGLGDVWYDPRLSQAHIVKEIPFEGVSPLSATISIFPGEPSSLRVDLSIWDPIEKRPYGATSYGFLPVRKLLGETFLSQLLT